MLKPKKMKALIIKSKRTEWIFCIKDQAKECKEEYCTGNWTRHDYLSQMQDGKIRIANVIITEIPKLKI